MYVCKSLLFQQANFYQWAEGERLAVERLQEKLTKENPWLNILHLLENHDIYAYEIKEKSMHGSASSQP
jgi:hypothetical protein